MLKRFTILCLFVWLALEVRAQVNLVPNGSFEDISDCQGLLDLTDAYGWFRPSNGTPDLFNECSSTSGRKVPGNSFGYQYAQDGEGYSGAYIFINYGQYDEREYIAIKLTQSLKPNRLYCFKMYSSLAENSSPDFSISSLGAYLSIDSIYFNSFNPLPHTPQIQNQDLNFINDTINWKLITGNYLAQGGERYIYIGNFRDSVNTVCETPPTSPQETYIFIDNVQLSECDSLIGVDEKLKEEIKIYPNPPQDFVSIDIPENYQNTQLSIYNLTGQLVVQKQIISNQQIPISELGNGMYIFVIESGDRVIGRERVVVER
jgi:OmpA-OmpF porin, OOP family